jgi:hypothetical protein
VRRTVELRVMVLCPHFQRPVEATRNTMTDRLVDCSSKESCRSVETSEETGVTVTVYPVACPVFRR